MLDPIVQFFVRVFDGIGWAIGWVIAAILWPFIAFGAWVRKRGFIIKGVVSALVLVLLGGYFYFFYQTQFWRGFDTNYVANYRFEERTVAPGEQVPGETGQCGPSSIMEVAADLTDLNVNQNGWVPSKKWSSVR